MGLVNKKVRTLAFIILAFSGIHSHTLQYTQKVHTHGVNIRNI